MFTKTFWKDVAERAGKTFIQTFVGLMFVGGVFNMLTFDWESAALAGGSAAVLSVGTSLLSASRKNTLSPASAVPVSPTDTF